MQLNKKIAGYCALAVTVLLALTVLALPPLIRQIAVGKIDQATGRSCRIDGISLNPFTLTAGISGVRLSEKGSAAPFLAFSSARLSLSPLSLPKRSFIVTEVKLSSPYLHIVRSAPNSFNFSDLLVAKKDQGKEKKGGTPLFSVNNITIDNGSIDFQDRALPVEKDHRVRGMMISVPFVSNMPYLADRYVTPHFSAVINDSPVRFEGKLKPLTRAVEATVSLNVKHLDLPFYLGYVPVPLPVKVNSGTLATALELGYRIDEKSGPETRVAGSIALDRIAVVEPGGAPLANLERAELKIRDLALMARRVDLASLELNGMELYAARDRLGAWNFQKLGRGPHPPAPEPEPKAAKETKPAAGKPLDLKLAKLSFKDGRVHLNDAQPKGGFKTEIDRIEFTLDDFSLDKEHRAPFTLGFKSGRGERLAVKGAIAATPLAVQASLELNGVPMKDYYPYLYDSLTAPIAGTLGVSAEISFDQARGLVIDKGALKLAGLAALFAPGEGVHLREALASGISLDLKKGKAVVSKVELKGGNVTLSGGKDGAVSALGLIRPAGRKSEQKRPAAVAGKRAKGKETPAPPFSFRVDKIAGSDLAIRYTDRSKEEAPVFDLKRLKFSLAGITGPKQGPIPFTLASGFARDGHIQASGSLTPQPFRFKGNVELRAIPLADFDPYLPDNLTVAIDDGALSTALALNLAQSSSGIKGDFAGSIGVRSFYCQETTNEQDLLKWESLQVDRISGTLGPFTLAIRDVALSNFYSRIIVEKDGTLNLQHLMEEPPAPPPGPAPSQARPAAKPAPAAKPTPPPRAGEQPKPAPNPAAVASAPAAPKPSPVSVDAVTVQGGTLDFTDLHLKTPFDTTFFNLGGRVSGLSSQTNRVADVDLRGNLENHSPLSITGTINPLRGDLFLDLKIAFNDIELSPLTPYSDTYLGYNVDKGKLFLDLSYRIDKKALTSQNKVFIDQFSFGKSVESDKATKLPVRLAVALLKDRKGEIHLDLPVTGQTDDPKFNVWKVVLQILKNLLVKAATSPFALLGSMFGGNEDFSAVYFSPGSDRLVEAEKAKLVKLAQALHDRPALNLEISGFVDRDRDPEGYRNELLSKKMKAEKARALAKQGKKVEGQSPDELEILPQEYPVYLKAVYVKEKFPKPRNALGFLKELPDTEMKKLIITQTVIGANELQTLARERAERVKDYLQKEGKLPAERLFEKNADIFKPNAKSGGSGSRVEFGANAK